MSDPYRVGPRAALDIAWQTPWRARLELERLALIPLARLRFALAGVAWGEQWRIYGLPIVQIHRAGACTIGARLELRSAPRSNPLTPNHPCSLSVRRAGARLQVGAGFGMTGGSIVCAQAVTIGARVLLGANCIVTDTDFHPLDPAARAAAPLDGATAPVVIEDDVFIGMNCLILKGVTIGRGSVIGAGSVVTRSMPPGVVAAGNPARVIRPLA
jgi:acetyltransferase-like isoleucine patch superfamily enzyme